ncbi:MAG: hypothetical protein QXZ25_05225 [Candidatus Bathyarchaeia archaeon]
MSAALKFSSSNIKSWLESETNSIFIPVHARAQSLLNEMRKTLENIADASKTLLDSSAKEIEKRNMKTYGRARALNKLARLFLDRIQQVKVPEKISYNNFHEFIQEVQRVFTVTEIDIKNWFPRISPFFILDRRRFLMVFERSKETLKNADDFLRREYIKTKTLEETFQLLDKLKTLEDHLSNLKEAGEKLEIQTSLVEKEIAEAKLKIAELKGRESISQLSSVDEKIETLSVEVKHALQHLQKPFIKLQAFTLHGGESGLTPEEIKKLNQYLENPFEALATEEADCPILKGILKKLTRLLTEGKIRLKPDKTRKAEQAIENILVKNSLALLHQQCVEAVAKKGFLSMSGDVAETKSELSRLYECLKSLEKRREDLKSEEHKLERTFNETCEKIRNYKGQIENNIFGFLGKRVQIE